MSGTDPTGTCYIADVKRQAPWTQSPQGPSDSYASDNREDSEAVEAVEAKRDSLESRLSLFSFFPDVKALDDHRA